MDLFKDEEKANSVEYCPSGSNQIEKILANHSSVLSLGNFAYSVSTFLLPLLLVKADQIRQIRFNTKTT